MPNNDTRPSFIAAVEQALAGTNSHVLHVEPESVSGPDWATLGRRIRILRGYRNQGDGTAVGFVASITIAPTAHDLDYGEWRAYFGSGEQDYASLTRNISYHGAKLHTSDSFGRKVIRAVFPELPIERYAN